MTSQPPHWIGTAIGLCVIAVVFAIRFRRMNRARALKVERLWIVPALYALITIVSFAAAPPHGWAWAACLVALLLGSFAGWQRGRMMRIDVDPETQALRQTGSPAAMMFILLLVLLRSTYRALAQQGGSPLHMSATTLTDILLAFALGLLALQRLEMFLRARRLLRQARGGAA